VIALVPCAYAQLSPGEVGLYFDREGLVNGLDGLQLDWQWDELGQFIDLPVYLLARDLPEGFRQVELGLDSDPDLTKLLGATFPEGTTFEQLTNEGERRVSFFVSAGGGCVATDGLVALAEFQVRFRYWLNVQVYLMPATPSSLEPPAPGYVDCTLQADVTWRPFAVASPGVEISTPDPIGDSAWGALKALYSAQP
jgi:hypothetical protein